MSPLLVPIMGICCGLLAIFGGLFVKPWMQFQNRRLELQAQNVAEKAAQYAARTEQLEQRVQVLERILTDRGTDLALEIEQLREPARLSR
jgi:lipopolysaccharide export LptBFGC system permease protein LptF